MRCYYHQSKEAVDQCQDCGKPLCRECSEQVNPTTCKDCLKEETDILYSVQKEHKKHMITGAVIFVLIMFYNLIPTLFAGDYTMEQLTVYLSSLPIAIMIGSTAGGGFHSLNNQEQKGILVKVFSVIFGMVLFFIYLPLHIKHQHDYEKIYSRYKEMLESYPA